MRREHRAGPPGSTEVELERRYSASSRRQAEALFARDAAVLAAHGCTPVDVQWIAIGGIRLADVLAFLLTGTDSRLGSLMVTYRGPASAARSKLPPVPSGFADWSSLATLATVLVCGLLGLLDTENVCGQGGRSTLPLLPIVLVIGVGPTLWPSRTSPNWWGIVGTVLGGLVFFGLPHLFLLLC